MSVHMKQSSLRCDSFYHFYPVSIDMLCSPVFALCMCLPVHAHFINCIRWFVVDDLCIHVYVYTQLSFSLYVYVYRLLLYYHIELAGKLCIQTDTTHGAAWLWARKHGIRICVYEGSRAQLASLFPYMPSSLWIGLRLSHSQQLLLTIVRYVLNWSIHLCMHWQYTAIVGLQQSRVRVVCVYACPMHPFEYIGRARVRANSSTKHRSAMKIDTNEIEWITHRHKRTRLHSLTFACVHLLAFIESMRLCALGFDCVCTCMHGCAIWTNKHNSNSTFRIQREEQQIIYTPQHTTHNTHHTESRPSNFIQLNFSKI